MTAAFEIQRLREIIIGLSAFGAGFAIYLAIGINLRDAIRERDPWPLAWTVNRLCVAAIVLLIAELVFHSPSIPYTWRVGICTVALLGMAISWVFIGIDHRRRNRRKSDRQEH